ncbi:hypothetical protein TWF730_001605 [Orbilia blumenaviensis]|uniref:Uncharacterized protein n=1 Tax=Orbilia blumenaviensis TaxID=1796055 RepID=A0AAV9ULI7_9PEZI
MYVYKGCLQVDRGRGRGRRRERKGDPVRTLDVAMGGYEGDDEGDDGGGGGGVEDWLRERRAN